MLSRDKDEIFYKPEASHISLRIFPVPETRITPKMASCLTSAAKVSKKGGKGESVVTGDGRAGQTPRRGEDREGSYIKSRGR